jgi:hypothetical protein
MWFAVILLCFALLCFASCGGNKVLLCVMLAGDGEPESKVF